MEVLINQTLHCTFQWLIISVYYQDVQCYLAIIQILLHILDYDPLTVQLIIHPLYQDADQVLQSGVVVGPGLYHGPLLILLQKILFRRNLG